MAGCSEVLCGCVLVDDYGTSSVTGDGSAGDPFAVEWLDPTFSRAYAKMSGGSIGSLADGATGTLVFTTEVFDSASMVSIGGQPTRMTFTVAGFYALGGHVLFDGDTTSSQEFWIQYTPISGVGASTLHKVQCLSGTSAGDVMWIGVNYVYFFEVGDYVQYQLRHSTGALHQGTNGQAWACYLGKKV